MERDPEDLSLRRAIGDLHGRSDAPLWRVHCRGLLQRHGPAARLYRDLLAVEPSRPATPPRRLTLTLATTARKSSGAGTLAGRGGLLPPGATLLLALAALFAFVRAVPKAPRRRLAPRLAAAALLVALMLVAGRLQRGRGDDPDLGTPAGTYGVTVQGTYGSLTVRDTDHARRQLTDARSTR